MLGGFMEYKKYEFCKAVKCPYLTSKCEVAEILCRYTAKDFHKWLKQNNFIIIKTASQHPIEPTETTGGSL
jgi:hypothetical protein